MIVRDDIVMQAHELASTLPKDSALMPKANTILAEAFSEIIPQIHMGLDMSDTNPALDAVLDRFADGVANAILNTMDIARNVINPMIMDIAPKLEAIVSEVKSGGVPWPTVATIQVPDLFYNETLGQMLAPYKRDAVEYDAQASTGWLAEYGTTETFSTNSASEVFAKLIEDVLKACPGSMRKDVANLFEDFDKELALQLILSLYGNVKGASWFEILDAISELSDYHPVMMTKHLMFLWLFTQYAMKGGSIEMLKDMFGDKAPAVSEHAREQNKYLTRHLMSYIDSSLERVGQDRIDFNIQESSGKWMIYVSEPKYNEYLDQGGIPEILYGVALSGDHYHDGENRVETLPKALERREYYEKVFERWSMDQNKRLELDAVVKGRESLFQLCFNALTQCAAEDPELIPVNDATIEARVRELAFNVDRHDIEEYVKVVRRVITKAGFPHTEAYEFLNHMDRHGQEHPHLEPRECARYAAEDIVGNWLAQQITNMVN